MTLEVKVFAALMGIIEEAIKEDGDNRYTRYGNYYKDAVMKKVAAANPEVNEIELYKAYDRLEEQKYVITTVGKRTLTKATKAGFKWFEEMNKPKNDNYTVFENKNWRIRVFGGDMVAVERLTLGKRETGYVKTVDNHTFITITTPKYIEEKTLKAYNKIKSVKVPV